MSRRSRSVVARRVDLAAAGVRCPACHGTGAGIAPVPLTARERLDFDLDRIAGAGLDYALTVDPDERTVDDWAHVLSDPLPVGADLVAALLADLSLSPDLVSALRGYVARCER